jgi:hypothetical protein
VERSLPAESGDVVSSGIDDDEIEIRGAYSELKPNPDLVQVTVWTSCQLDNWSELAELRGCLA